MTDRQFEILAHLYGFAPSRALRELVEAVERMEQMRRGRAFAQTLQDRLDETLEQRDALLEALRAAVADWDTEVSKGRWLDAARAAIAKAEE